MRLTDSYSGWADRLTMLSTDL